MKMLTLFLIAIIACGTTHSMSLAAEQNTATQYAEDAVNAMQQEYDALESSVNAGRTSAADLERKGEDLFEARLLLLTLRGDDKAIETILRHRLQICEDRFARLTAVRREVSAQQIQAAQMQLLHARLQLAKHAGDAQLTDKTLHEAIAIEESKLKRAIEMAERKYASKAEVARQQLRLARLMAHREIALPKISE